MPPIAKLDSKYNTRDQGSYHLTLGQPVTDMEESLTLENPYFEVVQSIPNWVEACSWFWIIVYTARPEGFGEGLVTQTDPGLQTGARICFQNRVGDLALTSVEKKDAQEIKFLREVMRTQGTVRDRESCWESGLILLGLKRAEKLWEYFLRIDSAFVVFA